MTEWFRDNWFKVGVLLVLIIGLGVGLFMYQKQILFKSSSITVSQQAQMTPDAIATYKAQYLQDGEEQYVRLVSVPESELANDFKQEKQTCETGDDVNVGGPENFDPSTITSCWNHISYAVSESGWVQNYINWKMSLISPSNSWTSGNQP